jgi:Glycosyltransferase family 87
MARPRASWWPLYAEPVLGIVACSVALATFATVSLISDTFPNDFSVFLESARRLRAGADLYQAPLRAGPGYNLNTPAVVLAFVPFSFLADAVALRIWTLLAIAGYALGAYWIAREVAPARTVTVSAAVVLSQPAITSLLLGQIGAALMLLVTAAWVADRRNRPWLAGCLLGLAIGAKPFLVVCAAYVVWRRLRALALGVCAGLAAATAIGWLAAGFAGFRSWLAALEQISWSAHVANGSLFGLFTRTLSTTPEVLHATPIALRPELVQPLWWTAAAIVGVVLVRTLIVTRDLDRAWAVALAASLLVSPLGWVYYATIFAGPLAAVALTATTRSRLLLAAGYVCLLVPPLAGPPLGRIGVLLFGSIYAWGFLFVLAGVAMDAGASVSRTVLPRGVTATSAAPPP